MTEFLSTYIIMCCYILDAVYVWMKVVVVSRLCEQTVKEAKEIIQIIHVCSIHNSDTELKNELVQFSLQVSLSEMDREDTHLFWLNDTFVTRVGCSFHFLLFRSFSDFLLQSIGTVATYLVVVIQWNEASRSIDSSGTNETMAVHS
ncbi:uncharacterized protein LOC143212644 isoform X1 [Lasioglossum baleicum]|uniref:uncharacterized protein LOC143212644 isoform X1 n=1 Tax=Lasioglossum baleicum TaxID=434251 RepID=UPI003FCE13FE